MRVLPSIPVTVKTPLVEPLESQPLFVTPPKPYESYTKPQVMTCSSDSMLTFAQGPFKSPPEVLSLRAKPPNQTLRMMVDVDGVKKARYVHEDVAANQPHSVMLRS